MRSAFNCKISYNRYIQTDTLLYYIVLYYENNTYQFFYTIPENVYNTIFFHRLQNDELFTDFRKFGSPITFCNHNILILNLNEDVQKTFVSVSMYDVDYPFVLQLTPATSSKWTATTVSIGLITLLTSESCCYIETMTQGPPEHK